MVEHVATKMESAGLEYWWASEVSELGDLATCPECGNRDPEKFKKEQDVLDVWFDSGSSNVAVREFSNNKLELIFRRFSFFFQTNF
jgi:isoleucyl-tRNA synthetase